MKRSRPHHRPDPAQLAKQFAEWLAAQEQPANNPAIDEEALRERAKITAERMKQARKRASAPNGDLYVMICPQTSRCKIGRSRDATKRINGLQTGSPTEIALWCVGRNLGNHERTLHKWFAVERIHGEWFSPAVTEEIQGVVSRGDHEAFASFVNYVRLGAKNRALGNRMTARRGTFQWRGKERPL